MNHIIKNLFLLQELELNGISPRYGTSVAEARKIKSLRNKVPESLIDLFDRWIARGKKPVAMVRHGVCCECHLKVASGVLVNVTHDDQIEHCGNCGRILYFVPDDDCTQRHSRNALKQTRRTGRMPSASQQSIQMVE